MRTTWRIILLLAGGLAYLAGSRDYSDPLPAGAENPIVDEFSSSGPQSQLADPAKATDPLAALGYVFSDAGVLAWIDAGVEQRYTAREFSELLVLDEHFDLPPGDPNTQVVHSGVASFNLYRVDSAGLDQYCVGGFGRGGDFILERWDLVPATQSSRSGPFAPPLVASLSGEILSKDFVKTRLFRGPLGDSLVSLGFDPEARFVIALIDHDQGGTSLYRFDNTVPSTPQVVYDSSAYPDLETLGHLNRFDHVPTGMRVWTVSARQPTGDLRMMMFDIDNDGEFDGPPLIGDRDYFENVGFPMVHGAWDSHDGTGN